VAKEGFANFTAYKAMEKIMPETNAWKVFYERIKQGAYQTDSTKGTTPIYQEIKISPPQNPPTATSSTTKPRRSSARLSFISAKTNSKPPSVRF
jgi:hypothetical protein